MPTNERFSLSNTDNNVTLYEDFKSLNLNTELINFIGLALQENPGWAAKLKKIDEAKASAGYLIDDSKPNLNISTGWVPGKERAKDSNLHSKKIVPWQSNFKFGWEIDMWGKWKARKNESVEIVKAELYTQEAAKLTFVYEIANLWYKYAYLLEDISLIKTLIRNHHDYHILHIHKYNVGLDDNESLILMENEIKELALEYNKINRDLESYRIQLQTFIAKPLEHNFTTNISFYNESLPKIPQILPVKSLVCRPDVLAVKSKLLAHAEKVKFSVLNLYPSLNLNLNAVGVTGSLSNSFEQWKIQGGPVIDFPLFSPKRRTDIVIAKQKLEILELEWRDSILHAIKEIESSTIISKSSFNDLQIAQNLEEEYSKLNNLEESKYKAGLISRIDLLVNRNRLTQAKRKTIAFKWSYFNSFLDLSKSLGIKSNEL